MEKYTTISISIETKRLLEKRKKNMDWDRFLRSLIERLEELEKIMAAKELEGRFTEDDEKAVIESMLQHKRNIKFREVNL